MQPMFCTYETTLTARCPNDEKVVDIYMVTIESRRIVECERILKVIGMLRDTIFFQEEITQQIAQELAPGVRVRTDGIHSGVKTTVVAGEL